MTPVERGAGMYVWPDVLFHYMVFVPMGAGLPRGTIISLTYAFLLFDPKGKDKAENHRGITKWIHCLNKNVSEASCMTLARQWECPIYDG